MIKKIPAEQSELNYMNDEDYDTPIVTSRGYVISKAISIENFIDKFIIGYFLGHGNTKEKLFTECILNNANIRLKINIFKDILSNLTLNKDEIVNLKCFFKDIDYIILKRNDLAHNEAIMVSNNDRVGYHNKKKSKLENIGTDELNTIYSKWLNIVDTYNRIYKNHFFIM